MTANDKGQMQTDVDGHSQPDPLATGPDSGERYTLEDVAVEVRRRAEVLRAPEPLLTAEEFRREVDRQLQAPIDAHRDARLEDLRVRMQRSSMDVRDRDRAGQEMYRPVVVIPWQFKALIILACLFSIADGLATTYLALHGAAHPLFAGQW